VGNLQTIQPVESIRSNKPVKHYQAYRPRPFLREQREDTTILFGGLTWKHERLIQGAMHNLHYKAEPLPNIARADLDAGKELIDVGACCPTIFTTGSLVSFLKDKAAQMGSKQEVADKYVFLTAGACGPCRFGQYHESYAMALDGLGMRDFRMFLLAQDQLDQGPSGGGGLEINLPLSMGLVWGILIADVLGDLEYQTRPYEVRPGQTDEVLKESVEYMYKVFLDRPIKGKKWGVLAWHLTTNYFTKALREVFKKWEAIEVDRLRAKAKVKITGEFWLQTHEGEGNYNIKRWLESEGAEVIPPPVAVWLDYLMHPDVRIPEHRTKPDRKKRIKESLMRNLEKIYVRSYNRFRKALGNIPYELPDQNELRALANPFYHYELSGGEGHMLVGKALYAYHHKKAHMVCELTPYSCMPNTMSVGSMANVLGKYPDLLYAPIEIKGDAEVHALSRCQMILTEAKRRAQSEFEQVMEKLGVSVEDVRRYEAQHPETQRASYRVPHMGYAGTAANYVAHLAATGKIKSRKNAQQVRSAALVH
jgi:predicted nucleotide-binding protein (sugar kinase/HSP70/actin superfamily)